MCTGELMIIVEFCQLGSLEKYLKDNRSHFIDQIFRDVDEIVSMADKQDNSNISLNDERLSRK